MIKYKLVGFFFVSASSFNLLFLLSVNYDCVQLEVFNIVVKFLMVRITFVRFYGLCVHQAEFRRKNPLLSVK